MGSKFPFSNFFIHENVKNNTVLSEPLMVLVIYLTILVVLDAISVF